jgi:hypothetical protein
VAWREEGDDASCWAAPGPWLLRAWRGGCPGRAARLGWGQVASLGQAGQLGRVGVGGKRLAVGSGSASGRVSAHNQFSI